MSDHRKLTLPPALLSASRAGGGLLVPPGSQARKEHSFAHVFVTWKALTEIELSKADIVERLSRMSAFDCLDVLGRLSCMVNSAPPASPKAHRLIIERLNWPEEAKSILIEKMNGPGGETRAIFFSQQVVHLARLAALHADSRPADNFKSGELTGAFIECLLGVGDVFEEPGLDESDAATLNNETVIPWILRQLGINGRHDSELLWSRYYDILVRAWEEIATPEAFDAAAAFERYTGISMPDWLTTGFAFFTRFGTYGHGSSEAFHVVPKQYFSNSAIGAGTWEPFLDANAQTLEECRESLEEEEAKYGHTQYRAQTFEERPLLRLPDGGIIPLALDSLERRCTEGMFFELADGVLDEGLNRSEFTSPFGTVFEDFVQRAWERMMPALGVPRVHRQKEYMRGGRKVEATDAVLDGANEGVIFCEVVSRRPRVATVTRGDWHSFLEDLESGPLAKARQLDLNIKDYRSGALTLDGLRYRNGQKIWPMLVLTEGFPTMPPIPQFISEEIERNGLLRGLPPLAILGSEDLGHLEGLLEAGFGAFDLIALWKGDPAMANLPFPNFLTALGDSRVGKARQAPFYRDAWAELTRTVRRRLFPDSE